VNVLREVEIDPERYGTLRFLLPVEVLSKDAKFVGIEPGVERIGILLVRDKGHITIPGPDTYLKYVVVVCQTGSRFMDLPDDIGRLIGSFIAMDGCRWRVFEHRSEPKVRPASRKPPSPSGPAPESKAPPNQSSDPRPRTQQRNVESTGPRGGGGAGTPRTVSAPQRSPSPRGEPDELS
jgi:hypothetical protein